MDISPFFKKEDGRLIQIFVKPLILRLKIPPGGGHSRHEIIVAGSNHDLAKTPLPDQLLGFFQKLCTDSPVSVLSVNT